MFSWLKRTKTEKDWTETIEMLEKRIRRIEEEWTDVYHKFRQLHMRVAKQVQRLDQAPEREDAQPEGGSVDSPQSPSALSPRARLIQRQILARRNARTNGGEQ